MDRTPAGAAGALGALASVDQLVRAADFPALRQSAVELFAELVPGTTAVWERIDYAAMRFDYAASRRRSSAGASAAQEYYEHAAGPARAQETFLTMQSIRGGQRSPHPLVEQFWRNGSPAPVAMSDVVSQRQFHSTAIWSEYFRPLDTADLLTVFVPGRNRVDALSLLRPRVGFSHRDRVAGEVFRMVLTTAQQRLRHRVALPAAHLTGRENQVLDLVETGASSREIADRLRISPRTVDKHLEHALTKLGARSRTEALAHRRRLTATNGHEDDDSEE